MNDQHLQALQYALQFLALPVTFQMSLDVGGACRARALSRPYLSWKRAVRSGLQTDLTAQQAAALERLDAVFAQRPSLADCSDGSLRRNTGWRQVRRQARVSLLAFGWPLTLPPEEAMAYRQVKGDIANDPLAQIRRTPAVSN